MNRTSVESSNIKSVGHDAGRKVLEVEFHNGSVFRYAGVDAGTHRAMLDAPSVGSFFHARIKGRFPHTKA